MFIRLTPDQIPRLWEIIKYAIVHVDDVKEENRPSYLYRLLHKLLSSKAQCFLDLDDERIVNTVFITQLIIDDTTGEKYLFMRNMYSFKYADDGVRKKQADIFKRFARKEQCSYISLKSPNKRIWRLAEMNEFREKARIFEFRLEE